MLCRSLLTKILAIEPDFPIAKAFRQLTPNRASRKSNYNYFGGYK